SPEVKPLTPEERILLKAQAKKEIERDLSGKTQELLGRFYPINSVIVRVMTEFKPAKDEEVRAKALKIKRIKAVVLIDNRIDLTPELKQATFTTIAAAIGYDKKRGDRIILQKVPFHLATPTIEAVGKIEKPKPILKFGVPLKAIYLWGGVLVGVLFVFWLLRTLRRPAAVPVTEEVGMRPEMGVPPFAREKITMLDQVKAMAERNPEKIAELLRSWLSE
ncbi:MAG: flagellar M-ring protein FliF C-terminal domain-containing protein, partial [Candidatus Margulisiibacteriota bacterium]